MNIAQLARKFGQAILPVRISVSDVSEILGEPAGNAAQNSSPWVVPSKSSASGHMLDLEFVERTDVGRVRDHNEDYLGYASPATPAQVRTHGWLFVLADGVGGQEQGEVASRTAVESMVAGFHKCKDGESHSAAAAAAGATGQHSRVRARRNRRADFGGHGDHDCGLRVAV